MSCHPMHSLKGCPDNVKKPMLIHVLVFGLLSLFVGIFFGVAVLRRWYLLRERLNTFWIISISILMFLPAWFIYFVTYLATINKKVEQAPPQLLMSLTNWLGLIPLGNTFAPLIAAWLQLSSRRRVTARRLKADWPLPLILTQTFFEIGAFTGCFLSGWNSTYRAGERIVLMTCAIYLWLSSASLWYGARKIKRNMKTLAKGTKTRAIDSEASKGDAVSHVTQTLNRALAFLVCCVFLPATIVLSLHTIFLEYVDRTIWATQLVWGSYRTFALAYIVYWGATFWIETDFRVSSSRTTHTNTNTSTISHSRNNDSPSPNPTSATYTEHDITSPRDNDSASQDTPSTAEDEKSSNHESKAKSKAESKADGESMYF